MTDQIKNMMIGFFVISACALIIGMILFIEPSVGDGKQIIIVRFANINGISVGTRVLFAGKAVGEVSAIETIPHARQQPIDHAGNVYFYQLILHVDSSVQVYNTDEITVQTSGLLGEKSIGVIPKAPPKGVKPKLVTAKTPVYGVSTDPLQNAMNELSDLAENMDEAIEHLLVWFDQNKDSLSFAISSFASAMDQISVTMKDVNDKKLVDDIKESTSHFSSILANVDTGVEQMKRDNFFPNLSKTVSNFESLSHSIDIASKDIANGTGTIGKLVTSDDMYLKVNALFSKVDTLMNDVNQYGLLFNYNKQWQRTRVEQANLLNSIRTPQSFKSYFETQVDTINTAMSRLSTLIEKAQASKDSEIVFKNPAFHDDFATLLRKVNELSESLKLYNQQLTEMSKQECP
ncbi:MAG: MCE family protein [Chlamydiales bacterium]|nr:MCE family protein [Chlamydiales bacterium]